MGYYFNSRQGMQNNHEILVADDDKLILSSLKMILEQYGYKVTLAENGSEALEKFGRKKFLAVILDLNMPEKSGLEALDAIRAQDRRIPVIILTGDGSATSFLESQVSGATEYLHKPVDPASLAAIIKKLS